MIRVFEAFCGVGSQRMALKNIGVNFEVVGVSEVDRYAILAYDAIHNNGEDVKEKTKDEILLEFEKRNVGYNFSTGKLEIPKNFEELKKMYDAHIRIKNFGDIRKINTDDLPDFDLFTYSFPCKNITNEGKHAGFEKESKTQSSLVWQCQDIIENKKPKFLLMENVKNIVSKSHMKTFEEWCQLLESLGYNNYWKVVNGVDFGVPQKRERVIMISILKECGIDYSFPNKRILKTFLSDLLEHNVDENLYVNRSKYKGLIWDSFDDNGEPIICIREATKKGYAEANVGDSINIMFPNSKTRRGRVGKKVCNTLTTTTWQCVIEKDMRIRRLTSLECWRLMGFKDEDYEKAKNIANLPEVKLYERAGRGIVVPMLEDILKELFSRIEIK